MDGTGDAGWTSDAKSNDATMFRLLPRLRPRLQVQTACLSTTAPCCAKQKQMPPRPPPPPEDEIDEMFVKGTGPGGQKILRHIPTGIVVKSQATRSRSENRAIARGLLAARLDEIRNPETCRTAALVAKKLKKRANATKKARRKYKKLAGDDEVEDGDVEAEAEVEGAGPSEELHAEGAQSTEAQQEQHPGNEPSHRGDDNK